MSFTADLHRLRDHLQAHGVTTVAMEATGVYWLALCAVLEAPARAETSTRRLGVLPGPSERVRHGRHCANRRAHPRLAATAGARHRRSGPEKEKPRPPPRAASARLARKPADPQRWPRRRPTARLYRHQLAASAQRSGLRLGPLAQRESVLLVVRPRAGGRRRPSARSSGSPHPASRAANISRWAVFTAG